MNILLLGSGGRECALAWKLAKSKQLNKLWIAPGNAGTSQFGLNIPIAETDFTGIRSHVLNHRTDMIVVGPEAPLAEGITDFFRNDPRLNHVQIVGPSQQGAKLESSKDFAKDFMNRHNIPTAIHKTFTLETINYAFEFLETLKPPYVLKADGLAAGKGVIIHQTIEEARQGLHQMLAGRKFGAASQQVLIEEFLHGIELSVFVLTDGKDYVMLPNAKDYKQIGEGDTGPNTGGMGSVSPVPFAGMEFMQKVENRIIKPTIEGLHRDKIDYCGFIFFGLMNCNGDPYVIEYNVRLGDPETEAIIPRIENDLIDLLLSAVHGKLKNTEINISENFAITLMLVSGGYPGPYEKELPIAGLDQTNDCIIFHAGTKTIASGEIVSNGGRVLAVTGMGGSLELARQKAYAAAEKISFEKMNYRRDIGRDLLQH
jgi:phosphoribosylamine---glycine ligase